MSETDTISWVTAHHNSPHGEISVRWSREKDGSLLYQATVPPNTTAELTLPKVSPWSGKDLGNETRILQPGKYRIVVK